MRRVWLVQQILIGRLRPEVQPLTLASLLTAVNALLVYGLVVPRGKFDSTNQKHYPNRGSEASSVEFLLLFLRCHFAGKPVETSLNFGCFLRLITVIRSLLFYRVFLGILKCQAFC